MTPEGKVKAEITNALKQMGYTPYRIQCGRWKVRGGWMHGAEPGTPDLQVPVMIQGMSKGLLWLECKQNGGTLRAEQVKFRDTLPPGEFWLAPESLDPVLEFINRHRCTPK